MLSKRLVTAGILIPIVFMIIWWEPPLPFFIFVLGFSMLGLVEFYRLCEQHGLYPQKLAGITGGALLLSTLYISPRTGIHQIGNELSSAVLTLFILLYLIIALIKKDLKNFLSSIGVTLFGIFYVVWLLGHMILIREIHYDGRSWILLMLIVTWVVDTAAYAFGAFMGRHKLSIKISPHKSVEGFIAGLFFAPLTVIACDILLQLPLTFRESLLLGILLGFAGQVGDLVESLLKRNIPVKDSGSLFPGHGGILDRCDSIMFNAPLLYYFIRIVVL